MAVGGEGARPGRRAEDDLPLFDTARKILARGDIRAASPISPCRRCRSARTSSTTIVSSSVAEGASGAFLRDLKAGRPSKMRHYAELPAAVSPSPGWSCRQRPGSANGVIFMTIEDETASPILVWPKVFERLRPMVLGRACGGHRPRAGGSGVIHVVADRWTI